MTDGDIENLIRMAVEIDATDEVAGDDVRTPSCMSMSRLQAIADASQPTSVTEQEHLSSCRLCNARLRAFRRRNISVGADAGSSQRPPRTLRWLVASGSLAAALIALAGILVLLTGSPSALTCEITVSLDSARTLEPSEQSFTVDVEVNQPAWVYVFAIDERREAWLLPFDEDATVFVQRIELSDSFSWTIWQDAGSLQGPAKTTHVIVIASNESTLKAQLLDVIPDPLPVEADQGLDEYLDQLSDDLEARFDCAVRVAEIPYP